MIFFMTFLYIFADVLVHAYTSLIYMQMQSIARWQFSLISWSTKSWIRNIETPENYVQKKSLSSRVAKIDLSVSLFDAPFIVGRKKKKRWNQNAYIRTSDVDRLYVKFAPPRWQNARVSVKRALHATRNL